MSRGVYSLAKAIHGVDRPLGEVFSFCQLQLNSTSAGLAAVAMIRPAPAAGVLMAVVNSVQGLPISGNFHP